MLEVIVENAVDAKLAEKYGANRLEVVSAISEGGLTPSYGVLKEIIGATSLPTMVMIRPHSHSFIYNESDVRAIQTDIEVVKKLGATGIVFGAVTEAGKIDTNLLEKVLEWKGDLRFTFHRAIEATNDLEEAYRTLKTYGKKIDQVLTSGGTKSAVDSIPLLKNWIADSEKNPDSLQILVGSGVTDQNIHELHEALSNQAYHVGSGARMAGSFASPLDPERIARIQKVIQS
ncbi:copper homeostasis protein CutC [Listeria kieliensis]|uniref:PF03932 family protein CutC n=1 Tax=Listeria kieliensis TaxID=1621700 RepID=A0A3D8TU36_9LIST|nr:copper homeostasis protein CutC [Listeria kieliensis]RDX02481.1 copper homeostasis protein CutC [Listeria kieliensis]